MTQMIPMGFLFFMDRNQTLDQNIDQARHLFIMRYNQEPSLLVLNTFLEGDCKTFHKPSLTFNNNVLHNHIYVEGKPLRKENRA